MSEPLNLRLRTEASAWDVDEPVIGLLLEAAEAVELLAAEVVAEKARARRDGYRDGYAAAIRYALANFTLDASDEARADNLLDELEKAA